MMTLPHLVERYRTARWEILPAALEARIEWVRNLMHASVTLPHVSAQLTMRPTEDAWGQPIEQMHVQDGIAIVPVKGTLVSSALPMDKWLFRDSDYQDIQFDLEQAANDPMVQTIVLDIDSPGGMVTGSSETAAAVLDARSAKPTYAWTGNLAASAAYKLAVPTEAIGVTASSRLGSVGTIAEVMNVEKMLENAGIEVAVFTSGKFKGMGHPAKALTQEQAAFIQNDVDELGNEFRSFVQSHRGRVQASDLEGQLFSGVAGISKGFADQCNRSLGDFIKNLKRGGG